MLLVEKATELSHSGAKEINQIRKGSEESIWVSG